MYIVTVLKGCNNTCSYFYIEGNCFQNKYQYVIFTLLYFNINIFTTISALPRKHDAKKKNVKIELLVGTVPNNSAIFQVCMNVTLDGLSYSFEVSLNRR